MRPGVVVTVLLLAVASGCKKESPVADVFARGSVVPALVGSYKHMGDGPMDFATLSLESDGKYTWTDVVVCVKAPCPQPRGGGEWKGDLAGSKGKLALRPDPGGAAEPHVYDVEIGTEQIRLGRPDPDRPTAATYRKTK